MSGPNHAQYKKAAYLRLRWEVLRHYSGGKDPSCACCGESLNEFLSIDHVGGGGNAHRKKVGPGRNIYWWLRKNGFPTGFRVLCHNCNLSRGIYGYCPHESGSKISSPEPRITEKTRHRILNAALGLYESGKRPTIGLVSKMSGHDEKVVCRHRKALIRARLWPGWQGMKVYQTAKGPRYLSQKEGI